MVIGTEEERGCLGERHNRERFRLRKVLTLPESVLQILVEGFEFVHLKRQLTFWNYNGKYDKSWVVTLV